MSRHTWVKKIIGQDLSNQIRKKEEGRKSSVLINDKPYVKTYCLKK